MAIIELKDVIKKYGKGESETTALKQIDFAADSGELVLIMGPSGAGKSTFLTIAGSLQKPTSGSVKIAGKELGQMKTRQRDRMRLNQVGFVLQAHNLVPYLTVQDQFYLVDKVKRTGNLTKTELADLLQQLGIANLLKKYPDNLSGGQQQRVAIARALYANPEVLLADEPTASLDSAKVKEVGQLFQDLAVKHNKAIIVVTHDPRLEAFADHIYDMMDGKLTKRK